MALLKPSSPTLLITLALSMSLAISLPATLTASEVNDHGTASADTSVEPQKLSRKERRRLKKEAKKAKQQALNTRNDWFPLSELSEQQRAITPPYCDGAYIEPALRQSGEAYFRALPTEIEGSRETQKEVKEAETEAMSDLGPTQLQADRMIVTQSTDTIKAEGDIEIRQQGMLIRGASATYNTESGTGVIENAEFVAHQAHARGAAGELRKESPTLFRLIRGDYTQCTPASNTWLLRTGELELNQETNMATAKHARLRVKDVPIFYFPWLTYPINNQRRSGLLFPKISTSTNSGGLDFAVPWYWNIKPNLDATFAGRYIAARGIAAEVETRYKNRFSYWIASGSYIDDQDYGDIRWYFGLKEYGSLPNNWGHGINYTKVSDEDYLNDMSGATSLEFKRSTNLEQSAFIMHTGQQLEFRADVVQYQIIDETVAEQYRRLPQLWLYFRSDPDNFRPTWLMEAQATQFDINDTNRAAGSRIYLQPGISVPMRAPWGYLKPTIKLKSVTYALDDSHCLRVDPESQFSCPDGAAGVPVRDAHPSTTTPMVSLDTGLFFERPTSWFDKSFTHTLEPRLYYLYNKYEDQADQPLFDTGFTTFDYNQLFRESRFTGYDRISDANQLSLGISTRLIQDSSGTETVWASIGQIYYFADRRVTLNQGSASKVQTEPMSPIAAELGYQWTRNLRSYMTALYDLDDVRNTGGSIGACPPEIPECADKAEGPGFTQAGVTFRYFGDTGLIVNAAYRYRVNETVFQVNGQTVALDDYINQTDLSTVIPVSRHWGAIGRYNYDHTNNRRLAQLLGVEYNSCCWLTRVLYQNGLNTNGETDHGIYFQFVFKGLGGADTGTRSILKDSIVNWEDYERRDHY